MAKFHKKPTTVDAVQFELSDKGAEQVVPAWLTNAMERDCTVVLLTDRATGEEYLEIHTATGVMDAKPGDWLVRVATGEIFPCSDDAFKRDYEPVAEPAAVPTEGD